MPLTAAASVRDFLVRGLLAGLLAGIVAFGVAYAVGEPPLSAAIAVEESGSGEPHQHDGDQGHPAEPAEPADGATATEVPRTLQSTVGLLTGTAVAGTALGGLLGVLSAFALGRLGRLGPRGVPLTLAGIGFVSLTLVPFAGYPPNPPAVGDPATIQTRTALFFILTAISVIAAITATAVARVLAPRWGWWYAALAAVGGFVLVAAAAVGLLPHYDEVSADFPASVLYEFRAASLLTQLALWASLGVGLGELVHRLLARRQGTGETRPAVEADAAAGVNQVAAP